MIPAQQLTNHETQATLTNMRNFGWGLLCFQDGTFGPTVSQRKANEAAESAAFINDNYKD